ncbi:PTS transporter subunit EIIC [Mycoplasma sp. CSL10137]|uniref:PTS transporter subunit IIABC n=1 Tax=Mycoplasma sp. CSL10137 TaxID=2813824 RepID=UPI00197BC8F4|nr:PTS transporter subunit IIABC [Mycoplasma sp. CSL10137]MBN4083495.1 PTS transporter subunit EIIC [Mycoplasma sp. CSL10137]
MKAIFRKRLNSEKKQKLNNSDSGKLRKILSKISGAFMLPISIMSIAGLFLGVGAAISGQGAEGSALQTFGNAITALGDPVFAALPLLFASAFVIAFTDEAGVGVFATIIGYMVFIAIQQVFISPVETDVFLQNKETKEFILNSQNEKIKIGRELIGYKVLFTQGGRNPETLKNLVGTTLGFRALQTSVFGGIAVGLTVQYLYNRFHVIQLPKFLSFFGGKRFVSIITIPASFGLALLFLLFWPWVGVGLNHFGSALQKVPYGIESLIFGYFERSLIPFGLHHVFYAPLWYSSAGGSVNEALNAWQDSIKASGDTLNAGASLSALINEVSSNPDKFKGDSTAAVNLLKFSSNVIDWSITKANGETINFSKPLFEFIAKDLGIKIGRFADGKFAVMMFGLPAAAVAMIFAAPKENRKVAAGTVLPAAFTSLVTGVTEPIEFTFLFLSPLLFWGFHAFTIATSFMFANLLGVHIPMVFSGGILDLTLYGIIPFAKGTQFYYVIVLGLAYAPIYFLVFYFWIKKADLATPGRGGNTKLFTKKDFLSKKQTESNSENSEFSSIDQQALALVQAFGGLDNIKAFNNCASRLRYDVKDIKKVNADSIKQAGAFGVKFEGETHVQAILGPTAEQVNSKIKSQRDLIAKWEQAQKDNNATIQPEVKSVESPTTTETKEVEEKIVSNEQIITKKSVKIQTVAKGELLPLESLNDGVFSEKLMGDGFVVRFDANKVGNVYSPVKGRIVSLFDSKHAYGIETKEGVKVLVHIGIDTVKLNGEGFKSHVKLGKKVNAGDKLATVDLSLVKENGYLSDVVVIVLQEGSLNKYEPIEGKTRSLTTSEMVGLIK